MSLANETLLAFRRRDTQPLRGSWASGNRRSTAGLPVASQADVSISFSDATRHIGVFGATGYGKTVGVVRPALRRMIEAGCPGMVLDAKSEFLDLADEFPDRVVMIGAGAGCQPFNILRGMPTSVFRQWLAQNRVPSRDAFWGTTAMDDASLVLQYYRARRVEPSLSTIVNALLDARSFVSEFDPWIESTRTLPSELCDAVWRQRCNAFGVLSLGGSRLVEYDARRSDGGKAQEQYTWQLQHLLPGIGAAVADPRVQRGLCADAPLELTELIYKQRNVLVVDLPESELGPAAAIIGRLLRTRYTATVLSYRHHARDGYGKDRFTFLAADEYQHHLHIDASGIAGGVYDDTSAFDRLRAKGHIQLIATQSVSALRARRPVSEPAHAVDCVLQNIGTVIAFANNDPETARYLRGRVSQRESEQLDGLLSGQLRRGEALVFAGDLTSHGGGIVASVRTGSVAPAPWMGRYIHHPAGGADADPERYAVPPETQGPNPFNVGADAWIAAADERFADASARLLNLIAEGWWIDSEVHVARTTLMLGRFDADFAIRLDDDTPPGWRLRIKGLGLTSSEAALELPLEALYRVAVEFPDSALTDVDEQIPLSARAEHGALALERSFSGGRRLTLVWGGVGEFSLDVECWRILGWAAVRYRALVVDALTARAECDGEVSL